MKITKIALVLLSLTSTIFAQENPAKLKLAREVIVAMQANKAFDGMMAQMKEMAIQLTAKADSTSTPEQRQKKEAIQGKIMDLSMNFARGITSKLDHIYAEVYSETELNAMKAFYTSPEGQSMIAKQPSIIKHMMPLIQEMQQDLQSQIEKLNEESK